ncbi:MAG TPA: DUF2480 family protein [Flavobacteriaceae bacterium]|nr:DUF2480 family protein [Flavobacteriaceae bacterium]
MEEEIINRIAKSPLQIFDLEEYFPEGERIGIDISQWLWEGFILKEKEFRESLKNHDWSKYKDAYVHLSCSTDAIIPAWAFSLVTMQLAGIAQKTIIGTQENLNEVLYQEILSQIDFSQYNDKPVLIKGCANKPVPENALVLACQYLQPFAKSIMFGEACSTVPLYKASKPSRS